MNEPLSSPITPELLVSGAVGISEVVADGLDVWWAENRPDEGGRAALVRWRQGVITEMTGSDVNVRTRVHEYGGGAWWVAGGRAVYADDARGGELFLLDTSSNREVQLTRGGHRYADGRFTADGGWFVCVRERHDPDDPHAVDNDVVAVPVDGGDAVRLTHGHDFYASPRIAPDGRFVVVAWDHPNMPWDSTRPHVGRFVDGVVVDSAVELAVEDEAWVLPDWTAAGRLVAVTDRSNWWNLVEVDAVSGVQTPLVVGSFEIATPGWVFGLGRWVEVPGGFVVVAGTPSGDEIHFPNGFVERGHSSVSALRVLDDGRVCYAGASFAEETAVWIHDGERATRISEPRDLGLGEGWFPPPEHVSFDVSGVDGSVAAGTEAHALFYAPANPEQSLDGLPPLLVLAHGGPTSAARRQLHLTIRFWTSRGVAVADVDYRGSTLYGREYRQALWGRWGVADTADCVAAATFLAEQGRVDPERMVIAGGSAGGLTVLNALARHEVFSGGISRYGVAELALLAEDTHKFEARYLDRMVGPWPEAEALYVERSPLTHVDSIRAPMLVLQGADDKVVPPNQSHAIVQALEGNGVAVRYLEFEGEGHGFRRADTIVACLEAELAFMQSL